MTIVRSPSAPSPRTPRHRLAVVVAALGVALVACVASTPPPSPAPPDANAAPAIPSATGHGVASAASAPHASTSAPAANVAASASASSRAPGACPAAVTRAPQNAFEQDEGVPGATELPIDDLDGDGVPEIVVSFPASYTERGLLVLKKVAAPACFQQLYLGVGDGAAARQTKTKGLADLSVVMTPITSNGRGSAVAIATYDGTRYRLARMEKCAGIDGKKLPAKECNAILAGYDDDAKGGAR